MIRFSKYIGLYFFLSGLVLVPGVFALVRWGLRPSVDFTGGEVVELQFSKPVAPGVLRDTVTKQGLPLIDLAQTSRLSYVLRFKPTQSEKISSLPLVLAPAVGTSQIVGNESVGPVLGKELLRKSFYATLVAIVGILLYVAYAFHNFKYGVSAILALVHDLLVVIGSFALLGFFSRVEVDTLFMTAFLTTMSFSVHDTIVVFDRIREYVRRGERGDFETICDRALTETMGRSLANSATIVFMLLALVLMGGSTIHWFAVALLIGTISGAYSSPFVATPILILWNRWERRRAGRSA